MRHERPQRNDGDNWRAEPTNVAMPLSVAAFTTPLLHCKLFVCSLLVCVA